ncbi:CPCC family cysteine-rich protein [Aestuariivirga sp.]|uniref:CPCC family cysteine-rich protein n=1 Tax=Aestuariivirga sp. TaxID=2650926 RepID=UPI0039E650FF
MTTPLGWIQRPLEATKTYRCPCCGCKTLRGRGQDEICPVCFWEDDGQDDADADVVGGGPNYNLSLTMARKNFRNFGAVEEALKTHTRPPEPDEL